jgi:hypothetical protein
MKRLITYNDNTYMPLWQTDLKFVQDNIEQVLIQLGSTFAAGRSMYIIAGCILTVAAGKYSVTQGLVMMDGEVLYVPAQEVSSFGVFQPHIRKKQIYNPMGEKQFLLSDNQTEFRNTWDDSYGELAAQPDPEPLPGKLYLRTAKSVMEIIQEQTQVPDTGWVELPTINNWIWDSAKVYYRVVGKQAFLRGDIIGDDASSRYFANVPAAYAPGQATKIYGAAGFNIIAEPSGKLKVAEDYMNISVILDGISWVL